MITLGTLSLLLLLAGFLIGVLEYRDAEIRRQARDEVHKDSAQSPNRQLKSDNWERVMTEDGWFYAEGERPIGPVTCDALVVLLRNRSEPGKVKVWRTGFPDWQDAKDVPQIFDQISRPPPLSGKRLERTPELVREAQPTEKKDETKSGQKNTLGRVVLVIALAIVLCVGGIFSTVIYNNSAAGIARLIGEFTSVALFLLVLAWLTTLAKRVPRANGESRWRRWQPSDYTSAFILVITVLIVGLNNRQLLLDGLAAQDGRAALKDVRTLDQLEKALAKNRSNSLLQFTAHALKEAQETDRLTQKLSDEIEPPSLAKDINYAKTTRAELEAYLRDLRTAEANATAAIPPPGGVLSAATQLWPRFNARLC
jgi:hypothetical protein